MSFNSYPNQILFILIISLVFSILANIIRSNPLSIIAEPINRVETLEELDLISENPGIRQIGIEIAHNLFLKEVLFVDAREFDYYLNGHIPNAICNDDMDTLLAMISHKISFDEKFIVYCSDDDCGSSEELAFILQEEGYTIF